MRILYVEDNKANLMLVERVAKVGGHEVVNRTKGETAIADFDTIQPDMVLMDIQLEGEMTGLEAVIKLRSSGHKLPIVALTAYAMKGDRENAIDAGCNEYLPKPLPINKLVELLKKYEAETKKQPKPAVAAAGSTSQRSAKPYTTTINSDSKSAAGSAKSSDSQVKTTYTPASNSESSKPAAGPAKPPAPGVQTTYTTASSSSNDRVDAADNNTEVKSTTQTDPDSKATGKQDNLSA